MAFVYDALDEDVAKELRKKTQPAFSANHHQWLEKFGRDKVRGQIMKDVVLMQSCDMVDFLKLKFARVFKKGKGTAVQLALDNLWALLGWVAEPSKAPDLDSGGAILKAPLLVAGSQPLRQFTP